LEFAGIQAHKKLHGRSFLGVLENPAQPGWDEAYASHTFHEVTMYYPMRVVRNRKYKLIWNLAHQLPFPFASDLYRSATWQDMLARGPDARYGKRMVSQYVNRPRFELYDIELDPDETNNLAGDARHAKTLSEMQSKLKEFQERTADPWLHKWEYE
jgi:N-sulfoglucosamine sulfohydrolase